MVGYHMKSLDKRDSLSYRIEGVEYDAENDDFKVNLVSHFANYPKIKVVVHYYNVHYNIAGVSWAMADTNSMEYKLSYSAREPIEKLSEEISNELRELLKGIS